MGGLDGKRIFHALVRLCRLSRGRLKFADHGTSYLISCRCGMSEVVVSSFLMINDRKLERMCLACQRACPRCSPDDPAHMRKVA